MICTFAVWPVFSKTSGMIPALDYYKMSRNIVCKLLCEHNQLDPCNITIQSSYYISAQSEQMGTGLKKAPMCCMISLRVSLLPTILPSTQSTASTLILLFCPQTRETPTLGSLIYYSPCLGHVPSVSLLACFFISLNVSWLGKASHLRNRRQHIAAHIPPILPPSRPSYYQALYIIWHIMH